MIISLSGSPGSGKSTIAQMLVEKLGWPRYYIGRLRREAARQQGLTLAQYNKLGETDPSTDRLVDDYQIELGKTKDNFVIEGRTSWYFIPHSFKIFLAVSEDEGAKRIFLSLQNKHTKTSRNEDTNLSSWEAVRESNRQRVASDQLRYQNYYQIDITNPDNYDLYLDTTNLTRAEVLAAVWEAVQAALDKEKN
ncbi:MAG: cytidylate kinase family protein [Patescibacteria group bacterium]|jgi:cytidylate kinase